MPCSAALSDQDGDAAGVGERRRRGELKIERDQWRARRDECGAGAGMQSRRPEVRSQHQVLPGGVAARHARTERARAAAAQLLARALRSLLVGGELAVEEHGHIELGADPLGEDERLRAGRAAVLGPQIDDGRDVQGADMRVLPSPTRDHVDPLHSLPSAAQDRLRDRPLTARDGEHRPVVVAVEMDVEQPCRTLVRTILANDRLTDRGDDLGAGALGDVRDGEEDWLGHAHEARLRSPAGVAQLVRAAES